MRRSIALLVGATAVLFASFVAAAVVAPAASASGARLTRAETAPAVPTDAVGVAPAEAPTLAINLDAGASEEHDVVVSNRTSNLRLTVRIAATDATGASGTGAGMWLAFGTNVVELDPHASLTIPMTIAVPHDTQPGPALAHVVVTVERAVAVADGSPRTGIVQASLPVSVQVTGASTAQIAVADVQRVDHGSQHELAMVLRNFGVQGAAVHGTVRVGGDHPQMLPFNAELGASGDTTVKVPWRAPPVGTGVDLAVEVDYDGGNTASWSSTLGGPPPSTSGSVPAVTPTTAGTADPAPAPATTATATATQPWWNSTIAKVLAVIAVLLAALWFLLEFGRSRRRRPLDLAEYPFVTAPPGWVPDPAGTSVLSERIVTLTEAIVDLAERRDDPRPFAAPPDRARSPGASDAVDPADHDVRAPEPTTSDPPSPAGHGPAPPTRPMIDAEDAWAAAIVAALASEVDQAPSARSASPTPSDVARPAPEPVVTEPAVAEPVLAAPSAVSGDTSGEARSAAELWAANEAEAEVRREALRIADEKRAAEKREQELISARNAEEKRAAEKLEADRRAAEAAEVARREAEDARLAKEFQEAEERRAAEWRAAEVRREEERRAAELAAQEAQRAAEWRAAEDRRIEEALAAQRAAEEARLAEAERRAEERAALRRAEEREADERRAAEAERRAQLQREADERRAIEEERRAEMRRAIEERNAAERERRAEERRAEDIRLAEERRIADERRLQERRDAEERAAERLRATERAEEERRAEARRIAEREAEERRVAAEERRAAERRAEEERRAEQRRAEEREAEERLAALERRRAEEHAARQRAAAERALAERIAAIARDRRAAEMAAEKRALEERVAHEQLSERVSERVVAESAAAERIAEEIRAAERLAERTEERLRAEREAAERIEAERRADRAAERVAQERVAAQNAAAEQLAAERRAERLAERAAQERLAADRAAQERLAAEQLARDRFAETVALRAAAENLAQERLAEEQAALERLTRVQGVLVETTDASSAVGDASKPTGSPAHAGAGIRSDPGAGSPRPPDTVGIEGADVADVADPGQVGDGRAAALERLAELERARRQMKSWMDQGDEVAEERWVPEDALLRLVGSAEPAPPADEG